MAELRNCPQCGRVFSYLGRNLCPRCLDKEEDEFKLVRHYIRENPGATITETAEGTGVAEQTILRFVRDGRLVSQGLRSSVVLECDRCGRSITEGRYCVSCQQELEREVRQTMSSYTPPRETPAPALDRDKIHILNGRTNKKR